MHGITYTDAHSPVVLPPITPCHTCSAYPFVLSPNARTSPALELGVGVRRRVARHARHTCSHAHARVTAAQGQHAVMVIPAFQAAGSNPRIPIIHQLCLCDIAFLETCKCPFVHYSAIACLVKQAWCYPTATWRR